MAFQIPEGLHPDLNPLAWLVGTWRGKGHGEYPGSQPFQFAQEVTFNHDGRPFLTYFSRSWIIDDNNEIMQIARRITYPVIIKAAAGGGGRGMHSARMYSSVCVFPEPAMPASSAPIRDFFICLCSLVAKPNSVIIRQFPAGTVDFIPAPIRVAALMGVTL